ncbi:MAG: TlpA family protein disulfide reductase [Crocinitomicaceae bacterium]|nr:TlpA family protein disulfide reductase [Crocinitomicaceae bacterium]
MKKLFFLVVIFCFSLAASACKYDLKVSTESEKEAKLVFLKYRGFELDTIEKFSVDKLHDFKRPLRDLDTGLYVISMSNEVKRMFFITKTEDVEIKLVRYEYFDDLKVSSIENKLLDSLLGIYNGAISEIDRATTEINQMPKTKKYYFTKTDSLADIRDRKYLELNERIEHFCADSRKSLTVKYFRPLFLVNGRKETGVVRNGYETDEAYQFDHFWDKISFPNRVLATHPMYYSKIDEYFMRYAEKTNEGLLAAADLIVATTDNNPAIRENVVRYILRLFERNTNEDFYLQASEKYLNSCEGEAGFASEKELIEKIKSLQVGKVAPDITVTQLGGEKKSLSSLKGNPVILVFWASWCPHCMEELPEIKKQYEALKAKNVQVMAVSLDEDAAAWTSAINSLGISDWIHSCEFKKWKSPPALAYNIHRTPTLYIIDSDGTIKAKDVNIKNLVMYF